MGCCFFFSYQYTVDHSVFLRGSGQMKARASWCLADVCTKAVAFFMFHTILKSPDRTQWRENQIRYCNSSVTPILQTRSRVTCDFLPYNKREVTELQFVFSKQVPGISSWYFRWYYTQAHNGTVVVGWEGIARAYSPGEMLLLLYLLNHKAVLEKQFVPCSQTAYFGDVTLHNTFRKSNSPSPQ